VKQSFTGVSKRNSFKIRQKSAKIHGEKSQDPGVRKAREK